MKSLYESVLEKNMEFTKKIELDFTINKTLHATERQSRHGVDKDNFISDDEILEEVKRASETIIEDILQNNIRLGWRFIVRNPDTDLNVVCSLHKGDAKDHFRVDIITVMRSEEFRNQKNTWTIINK